MARIIPVGYGEAAFVFTGAGGTAPYVMTLGIDLGALDPTEVVVAANDLLNIYMEAFDDVISTSITLDHVDIAVGLANGSSGTVTSTTPPQAGDRTGDTASLALAPVLTKSTGYLGREGRGRCFGVGMLAPGDVDPSGSIGSGKRTDLALRWNTFLGNLTDVPTGGPLLPVLFHNDPTLDPTVIISGGCSPKAGYIRQRV